MWSPGKRVTRKPFVVAASMLGMFMVAVESTIVATAMPSIAADLGGFSLYSWVFAGYLIAQVVTVMLFGKLADIFGRRPVLIVGIAISLVGALFCGLAWSMPALIVFRIIQGLGSATIQPVVNTVIGDLYAPEERAVVQSYLTTVWVVAAVVGPLFGGIIVQNFNWEWVFWVNIPIGLLTMSGFAFFLKEEIQHRVQSIDYLGTALFAIAMIALLIVISQNTRELLTPMTIVCAVLFVVALPIFIWQERRAADPMIALDLWRIPVVAGSNAAILVATMIMIGIVSYQPVYVQGVLGESPLIAGISLIGVLVSWSLATYLMHWLLPRFDTYGTLRMSAASILVGGIGFAVLNPAMGVWAAAACGFFIGFGMGLLNLVAMLLIQASVPWSKRGTATATFVLARMIGNAAGVAILGTVLNRTLYAATGDEIGPDEVRALLGRGPTDVAGAIDRSGLDAALELALGNVFLGLCAIAVISSIVLVLIPAKPMRVLSAAHHEERRAVGSDG